MAQLIIRGLDDALLEALQRRAEARGRTVEEEARVILQEALASRGPQRAFVDHLLAIPVDVSGEEAFPRVGG